MECTILAIASTFIHNKSVLRTPPLRPQGAISLLRLLLALSPPLALSPDMTSWGHYCDFLRGKGLSEVMIISSVDGAHWASSPESFVLREYSAAIAQEDGTEQEQTINEASNIVQLITKGISPAQGVRLNGGKKQTIIRNFKDDKTGGTVIYGKFPQGGSCVADGGRCIVVGTFSEASGQNSADCNTVVTLMARYLKESTWPDGMSEGGVGSSSSSSSSVGGSQTWQPFIDSMLIGKGSVAEAIICSKVDGKVWASSKGLQLLQYEAEVTQEDGSDKMTPIDEGKAIVTLMNSAAGTRPSGGIRIGQTKFQFLKGFDDDNAGCLTVYGKKSRGGCCIVATKKAIVITTFDEGAGHTATACNAAVSDLAKYLATLGY